MFALIIAQVLVAAMPHASVATPRFESSVYASPRHGFASESIRKRRPVTIGGEIGFNGLTGFGINAGYNFDPHWSLDSGAGLALGGFRIGARGRYNFLTSYWTPFVGLGASYLFAMDTPFDSGEEVTSYYDRHSRVTKTDTVVTLRSQIQSAPFGSATLGMSYQGPRGFAFIANLGWAQLLDRTSNIVVTSGRLTKSELRSRNLLAGSGPVASLMLGYSF